MTPSLRPDRTRWISLALAGVLSFSVWALSPLITGRVEPWDADWNFYLPAVVIIGGLLGFAQPNRLLQIYFGAWFGQLIALAVLPGIDRGWFLLGIFTTAIGSVPLLVGAAIGALCRKLARRFP